MIVRAGRSVTTLIGERTALLRLLVVVGWPLVVALAVAMLAVSVLPAATAVAVGGLVGRGVELQAGADIEVILPALAVVAALLLADLLGQALLGPFRSWVANRVNGGVRRMVRQAVASHAGIGHLEDQEARDAAALAVDDAFLMNVGAAAEGQLWVMTRFAGALVSSAVVASASVPLAVFVFAAVTTQRGILRRHYARSLTAGATRSIGRIRALVYWSGVAGSTDGAKELRVFGFRDWAVAEFARNAPAKWQALWETCVSMLPKHGLILLLMGLSAAVPFYVLGAAAIEGQLSAAQLAAALSGVLAVAANLGGMGAEAYSIEFAVPQLAAVRSLQLRDEKGAAAAVRVPPRASPATDPVGPVPCIRFDDVWFRYLDTRHDILRGLTLELRAGESVAIVGENGVGKTTLLKLLAALYQPTRGRILVDGTDLAELDPVWWRQHLAVVFQDFARWELSAFDNVALAGLDRPSALEDATRAAAAAGALDMIKSLPAGWQTILSRSYRSGTELSGGQWQRVALARALYAARCGAKVLVLDEPTASLDVAAEVALFDQLLEHAGGLTAVVVSHRFSTVRRARRIVVLGGGAVVEDGDHATLMALGGVYARLYELQASKFRHDPTAGDANEASRP